MANKKTAFITGANKGIGFQIASDLGKEGFTVLVGARNEKRGTKAVNDLKETGIDARFIQIDVSDMDSIRSAFHLVRNDYDKLDVIVNNAGILHDSSYNILDVPQDIAIDTLQTNALGSLWVIQIFASLLEEGSRVINMSSSLGSMCDEITDYAPIYSISKTTMNAITKHLDYTLYKRGILVNSVSPGWVQTDMGGQNASRTVEQGADSAVWLATKASESIHG
ncbi:MAG: SDR family NAD(P)-dependent oxidoreductase, partial [Cyclobacteriaceae bacterium]